MQVSLGSMLPLAGTKACEFIRQVDAHFHRQFDAKEIYELHGSLEKWQCAGVRGDMQVEPCSGVWDLPSDVRFDVDPSAMRADGRSLVKCEQCGGKARPNVLMFFDTTWNANEDEEVSVADGIAQREYL